MSDSTQQDIRIVIISRIWAYATGMIALSVLFGGPGRDWKVTLLPATIASGAALSTIVVWGKSNSRQRDFLLPDENLSALKQRIEDLEVIATSSNVLHEFVNEPNKSLDRHNQIKD
jgi:hypothetical protein